MEDSSRAPSCRAWGGEVKHILGTPERTRGHTHVGRYVSSTFCFF